jgi:AcrR family transcriptional regulator
MKRADSTARTRERVIAEARRLFRERGYAATSLEQVAEAAGVTKGAIYGHFSSKEDLLLSAIEATPNPDWATAPALYDQSVPLRERLAEFGQDRAVSEATADPAGLAVALEFFAAVLRSPEGLKRYQADQLRRLTELAAGDEEQPSPGTTTFEAWGIGAALLLGLQVYQQIAPEIFTPALFGRAFEMMAGLYPDDPP